jgi:NAD(P)-dependent dehydrogenase (short-subunit alcohol dehydrogenase family)
VARRRYSLDGKAVLITGAARGIGAESARRIAKRGGRVALVGLEPQELERVAAECGPEAIWFEADVTDRESLEAAISGTVERFGGIDVAMANAGVGAGGLVVRTDPEWLERVIEINLIGAARTLRLCLPHVIERRGYLLPVASLAAVGHAPGMAPYAASKAGIEAFADSLRMEVAHHGVGVGVAYFSWIDTDMVRGAEEHKDFSFMRSGIRGPLAKTYPVSAAADSVVRGIERRSRWVMTPRWLGALIVARGLVQPLVDSQVSDRIAELEQLSAEEEGRLGAAGGARAIGAGGEAAVRSAEAKSSL